MRRKGFIVLMMLCSLTLFSQTLTISHTGEDHPFHASTTKIITEAYRRLGYDLEFKEFTLERAAVVVNNGTLDGELFRGIINPSEYPNLVQVPVAIAVGEISAFTKGLNFEVDGWESLRPYRLSTQNGLKPAEEGTKGMNVRLALDSSQLFKMLDAGRVDVVILPKDVGENAVYDGGYTGISALDPPVKRDLIFHYVNSKHANLVPKLEAELRKMQDEGFFEKLN